jgi:hypothetical protein
MSNISLTILCAILLAAGCTRTSPAPEQAQDTPAPAEAATQPPASALETPPPMPSNGQADANVPAFADKVWRVVSSTGVEPGTTYAFLTDGTLVIENPIGNPPGYGKWRYQDGKLSIEEEGIAYPTDILRSDENRLELRSHNPGGTLDITLEHMPGATLPEAP